MMSTEDDRLPWFKCFPEKLLNACAGLHAPEQLLYLIIILRIYDARGPIADDIRMLASRTRMTASRVEQCLDRLIEIGKVRRLSDGRLSNPIADRQLVSAEATRKKNSASAKSRWQKHERNQQNGDANALPIKTLDIEKERLPLFKRTMGNSVASEQQQAPRSNPAPDVEYYRRGKELIGEGAGGLLRRVLIAKGNSIPLARAALETASTKMNPREYLGAIIRGARPGPEVDYDPAL